MIRVAALLDGPASLAALRRSLPREIGRVHQCRNGAGLLALLDRLPVDSIVLGLKARRAVDRVRIRARYPTVPILIYGAIRSDEGRTLLDLDAEGARGLVVEGVDDPVAGELVVRLGAAATRRAALADLPRALRLTEPLQRNAFALLAGSIGRAPTTDQLARKLGRSREHLSRQFGAGGAPNLKRVIGLLQALAAQELLRNPGFPIDRVARVLGYSSPSHFRAVIRRLLGCPLDQFQSASLGDVVRRFLSAGARSRV